MRAVESIAKEKYIVVEEEGNGRGPKTEELKSNNWIGEEANRRSGRRLRRGAWENYQGQSGFLNVSYGLMRLEGRGVGCRR